MAAPSSRSSIFQLLKQRFVGPKQVELEVSAYGKLPIYKDFLRHGLAAPEAQAFRRWLDRGVSKFWETHEAYGDAPIPDQALMVSFPTTSHQILAYLWDSHDHGGLRRFPFVLFVSLPLSKSEAPLSLLYALDQFLRQAEAMRRQLASLHRLDDYYPFIRTARVQLEIHGDKSLKERLAERQEPTLGDLGDIFYGEHDAQDRWPALIHHLRHLAQRPQHDLAVRLPRTESLPAWELNALYCLLLKGARINSRKPLQMFFPPGVAGGGVTILHRDLRPDDIFTLHAEMPDYHGIDDLRSHVPGARAIPPKASPPAIGPGIVEDSEASAEALDGEESVSAEETEPTAASDDADDRDAAAEDSDSETVEAEDVDGEEAERDNVEDTVDGDTDDIDAGNGKGRHEGAVEDELSGNRDEGEEAPPFQSALGKEQRSMPPIALLDEDLLKDDLSKEDRSTENLPRETS